MPILSRSRLYSLLLPVLFLVVTPSVVYAQVASPDRTVVGANVRKYANGVLAIMSYTAVPDVTTSSLSINNGTSGNPGFGQTQFGGGFTLSRSLPLYLEGTVAYSRYDPIFIATSGNQQRPVPVKWNTASSTIGIG